MKVVRFARVLTLDRLLIAIVFIAVFTIAVRAPADTDTWWHLQSGRWIVQERSIPKTDPFSHTRYGESWIDHSWAAQIVLYLTYEALGYAGLALLVAALATLAFVFVWLQCKGTDRWLRAFVVIIAAAASGVIWAARPQMLSFALAAIFALILSSYRRGNRKVLWTLPALMAIWVNLHGGFAVGFILIVATLFGEIGNQLLRNPGLAWRDIGRLGLVLGLCLLAIPLNPYGLQMVTYPFRTIGIGVLQDFIAEWRPPDFHQLHFHPFIWMVLAVLTTLGLSGRRADFTDLTLVALFTYMSLLAGRNIALFALVAAPVVVRYGSHALEEWRRRLNRPVQARPPARSGAYMLNWALLTLVIAASSVKISQPISAATNEKAKADMLPVEAVRFLRTERPAGPLFNSYNWGGYLIWELPDYPVFVDGRTDLYDDEFLTDYLSIVFAEEGWSKKLDTYGINLVLIEPQSMLGRMLEQRALNTGEWKQLYRDDMAAVFTRETGS
jgi:hypothetical protein